MSKLTHRADAREILDDRGYNGPLIRGQNPALLFEKPVRDRITDSYYWKEQCFALNAATLCDRAVELTFIGGTFGQQKPTPFLCLAFKLLQLTPNKEIIMEYLNAGKVEESARLGDVDGEENEEPPFEGWKYLRALAAFYIRLTWEAVDIYKTLEPLFEDYRKLKRRTKDGFRLTYVDQFVDDLLTKDRVCATSLWKLPTRAMLEDLDLLDPRESPLGDEIEALDDEEEVVAVNGGRAESEEGVSEMGSDSDRERDLEERDEVDEADENGQ